MAFSEKIRVVIDVVADQASSSFRKLKTDVAAAETSMGKLKAGGASAMAGLQAAAGGMALAGGAALVTFGAKAVSEFQEVAIGAGQLRDSLGLTAEEASRLQEVAADLGISTQALEANIGRMNRTAETSPEKFDAIGAAIQRNSDGTVNVNETFLSTIDALNKIPDATKRAARAQEIFGRSWMDVAELVGLGADGVREAMAGVEDAKIIDDAEIAKARKFRDAMDGLKGVVESLTIEVGGSLVPVLSDAAETMTGLSNIASSLKLPEIASWVTKLGPLGVANKLVDVYEGIGGAVSGLFTEEKKVADYASTFTQAQDMVADSVDAAKVAFEGEQDAIAEAQRATEFYAENMYGVEASIRDATEAQERQNDELREQRDRFRDAADAVYNLHDAERAAYDAIKAANEILEDEDASLYDIRAANEDAVKAIDDVITAQVEAAGVTRDSVAGNRKWNEAMLYNASTMEGPVAKATLEHIARMNGIPEEKITEIMAQDNAALVLADHLTRLGRIPPVVTTRLRVTGQTVGSDGRLIGVRATDITKEVRGATGGIVTQPTMALIGEAGPEAVIPLNKAPGASPLPTGASSDGARIINLTVNAGMGADGARIGNMIIETIKQYERHNGAGWRS
jgi:hypothetical protein